MAGEIEIFTCSLSQLCTTFFHLFCVPRVNNLCPGTGNETLDLTCIRKDRKIWENEKYIYINDCGGRMCVGLFLELRFREEFLVFHEAHRQFEIRKQITISSN